MDADVKGTDKWSVDVIGWGCDQAQASLGHKYIEHGLDGLQNAWGTEVMDHNVMGPNPSQGANVWDTSLYTKQAPKIFSKKFGHAVNTGRMLTDGGTRLRVSAYRRGIHLMAQAYVEGEG